MKTKEQILKILRAKESEYYNFTEISKKQNPMAHFILSIQVSTLQNILNLDHYD